MDIHLGGASSAHALQLGVACCLAPPRCSHPAPGSRRRLLLLLAVGVLLRLLARWRALLSGWHGDACQRLPEWYRGQTQLQPDQASSPLRLDHSTFKDLNTCLPCCETAVPWIRSKESVRAGEGSCSVHLGRLGGGPMTGRSRAARCPELLASARAAAAAAEAPPVSAALPFAQLLQHSAPLDGEDQARTCSESRVCGSMQACKIDPL